MRNPKVTREFWFLILLWMAALHCRATTYYLSPTGSDTGNGLSAGAAWLTPNHGVNCGDVILASPSASYSNGNFQRWGVVNCPGGNNVAWLSCATFDGCKIQIPAGSGNSAGMMITNSYWGVQGWEVDDYANAGNSLSCYGTYPSQATVHHVIFANNIASTCPLAGFGGGSVGRNGTDYLVIVGNIAYNGGTSNTGCGSNIDVFSPVLSDTVAGTHILVAGNFSWHSVNPANANCYDGEGIIFDTFDGSSTTGLSPYTAQVVIENNFSLSNGGPGILVEYNSPLDYWNRTVPPGVGQSAVYVINNTMWGNSTGVGTNGTYALGSPDCGEYRAFQIQNTHASGNLAVTSSPQCYGNTWINNGQYDKPNYSVVMKATDGTSSVGSNWAFSPFGLNQSVVTSTGFTLGSNTFGTDPQLVAPSAPGPPNCSTFRDVPHCMASVVANFTPQTPAAKAYGYQVPRSTAVYDPLFPQWLCGVSFPAGLISMGCGTGTTQLQAKMLAGNSRH